VTADILDLHDTLAQHGREAAQLQQRLAEMRQESASFIAGASALAGRLGLDVPAPDARAMLAAIRATRTRLAEQSSLDGSRRTLAQEAARAAETVVELSRAAAARAAALEAAILACGAADVAQAEANVAAAAERAARVAAQTQARATLLAEGDGMAIEALRAEAASVAADDLLPALEAALAEGAAAQDAAQQAAAELARLEAEMQRSGGDTAYANAVAAEAAATASADRVLREALTARLAAALLTQAMEAMAADGGGDMLARIGAWFRTLTGGAYRQLATEADEQDRQLLIAIPSDRPEETKHVHQLSEGTRDQLFLALRLEAVRAHQDRLPFIADDILQSFDDTRATAALGALLTLSETVQVIVLTHHRHVVELARAQFGERVWLCGLGGKEDVLF
jgi:uncharacterized protein YhaN